MISLIAPTVRAEQAARHTENLAAAAFRSDLKKDQRAETAMADWANEQVMIVQLARPLSAEDAARIAKVGQRAHASASEIRRVLASARVSA